MERRFAFTKARIEKLPDGDKALDYFDTEVKGLQARKEATGRITFRLKKFHAGKRHIITLGTHPEMSVHEARGEARVALAKILRGEDPNQSKRESASARTLGQAVQRFLDLHSKPHRTKKVYKADVYYASMISDRIKRKRLHEVLPDDLSSLHKSLAIERGKVTSNKVIKFIHSVYLREKAESPAAEVKKFKETPRERYLTEEEIPRFFEAVFAYKNETLRDFFLLAVFTGLRRSHLQSLEWMHVNFDRGILKFTAAEMRKSSKALEVPLIGAAHALLKRRYENRSCSKFVFPSSKSSSGHIVEPKKAWASIRKEAKIEDITIHDLRRSVASWMAISNANVFLISKLLGHQDQRSTAIYTRLQGTAPIAEALDASTTKMLDYAPDAAKEILGGKR